MIDLQAEIQNSAKKLEDTLAFSSKMTAGGGILSDDCYELWRKRSELCRSLAETDSLLLIRDSALAVADSVMASESLEDVEKSLVRFCGQIVPFSTARHLALATYVTTTWAVYDRVANVCGRLAAIDSVGNDPRSQSNPKLCEFFYPQKDKEKARLHGFSLNVVLPAYAWPTRVSYLMRNWLVHEGLEMSGVPLFAGNGFGDAYSLHSDAIMYFKDTAEKDGAIPTLCCLAKEEGFPWYDKNVLGIMKKYNSEVDRLLVSLLKWCVGSFVGQVTAFAERDQP